MISAFLYIGFFGLYLVSLSGTFPAYRDSGDMINAVSTLGIAHPPGYPLYVLIGKLFTVFLPFGTAAFRVNLLSAFFAAAALALLYRVLRQKYEPLESFFAVLLLGLSPAVLALSRVSEMYAMLSFFAVGIIGCRIWNSFHGLFLASFFLGLGFGVHPTLLFLAPLLVTFRKDAIYRAAFFALGFSVVLFLIVRAQHDPLQNWGNPSTFTELWRMITRSNYGGLKLHPVESEFVWTLSGLGQQIIFFLKSFAAQGYGIGFILGILGIYSFVKERKNSKLLWGLIASWMLAGPLFFVLSNLPLSSRTTGPILEPYLVLVNVIWALWVVEGLRAMLSRANFSVAKILLGVILVGWPVARAYGDFQSYRRHYYAYDLGRNVLRTLPPRAVLYDPDDAIAFTVRGLQLLEHRRDDVILLNFFRTFWGYKQIVTRYPDFLPPAAVFSAQDFERLIWTEATKRRPFYAELPVKIPQPMSYRIEGILYPIVPKAELATPSELLRAQQFEPLYIWRGSWHMTHHQDFFTRQILNYRSASLCNLGMKYAERKEWAVAKSWYEQALLLEPTLPAAHNNLGVVEFEQRNFDRAMRHFQAACEFEPRNPGYRKNFEMARQAKGAS